MHINAALSSLYIFIVSENEKDYLAMSEFCFLLILRPEFLSKFQPYELGKKNLIKFAFRKKKS